MAKRIAIIQGHPDREGGHYLHALADAYREAARHGGFEVDPIDVAKLPFPLLASEKDYAGPDVPSAILHAQDMLRRADHWAIFFPLWLGEMPAVLKGFLEQVLRPGFAYESAEGGFPKKLLTGKSARIVATMGMPALIYRCYYRAHGVKSLKRSILGFCGMKPIRCTLIGMIGAQEDNARRKWLARIRELGRAGA